VLTSEYLTHVRRLAALSSSSVLGLADTDLYSSGDLEIAGTIVPMLRSLNEEYLVRSIDVASVGGRVPIPDRASGAAVRLVQLVLTGNGLATLPRLSPENDSGAVSGGQPCGFYFDGGGIVLLPTGSNGTLRVRYATRPGKMAAAAGGIISTISYDTPSAGRTRLAISTTGSAISGPVDVLSNGPAHDCVVLGVTPLSISATQVDLTTTADTGAVRVGDRVVATDTTPYVPLPEECASPLISLVAARILRQMGYQSESAQHLESAHEALGLVRQLLAPRSDGNPKRLTGGILSRTRGWGWTRGW